MPLRRARRGVWTAGAGAVALLVTGVVGAVARPHAPLLEAAVVVGLAAWVVVVTLLRARARPAERLAWWLIAAAAMLEVAGRAGWWLAAPSGADQRWPLVASASHAAAATLLVAALLRLPRPQGHYGDRGRAVLDAATVTVAVALVTWNVALWAGPVSDLATSATAFVAAHALVDVVLAATGLIVLSRARHPGGEGLGTLLPLCAAALALGAADAGAASLVAAHVYRPGEPVDLFLVAGLVLLAAFDPSREQPDLPADMPRRERVAVLASVAPIVMVALAVVAYDGAQSPVPGVLVLGVMALSGLLLLRLVLALLDNLVLARTLETEVAERTLDLVTREQWFRSLVQNSSDVVTVLDTSGVIRYLSPAVERLFGYDAAALVGTPLSLLLRPADARALDDVIAEGTRSPRSTYVVEFPIWHREGRWCESETVVTSLVDDPDIAGLVLNTRDVSERKQLQDRLTHQAYHDALTGLANRVLFQHRLSAALDQPAADRVSVLFCDLNGFKAVNDAQGHDVGDILLQLVAERLRNCVRPADLVARFGGDEFAVLVLDRSATKTGYDAALRIADALRQPFAIEEREVRIGVSIGIAANGAGATSAEVLLRNADLAMYRAKGNRSLDVVVFEPAMHDQLLAQIEVQDDLAQALGRGELVLHYQPTVDLASGLPVGVEALMRWYHPERGVVAPDEFIAIAEENGYIDAMGEWALFEACRQGARWQCFAAPGELFSVSVNISARQIEPALVEIVQRALDDSGLPPEALLLEVTESVLMERADEAVAVLRRLKTLGVRVAIDDFGTGYSSLSYLSRFPVDVLKIDKHFVEAVAGASQRSALAHTIIDLGRQLKLCTVAEGIESPAQWAALRAMGCDLGQGYLFSRPLPPSGVASVLEDSAEAVRRRQAVDATAPVPRPEMQPTALAG